MCLLFFLYGGCSLLSTVVAHIVRYLLLPDDTLCAASLAWRRLRFAFVSAFPNVSVHVINVVDGILHDHRFLLSRERSSFAVLLLSGRL